MEKCSVLFQCLKVVFGKTFLTHLRTLGQSEHICSLFYYYYVHNY